MAIQAERRRETADEDRLSAASAKPDGRAPRSVVILGATGSIGKSTADIITGSNGAFTVAAVAGGLRRERWEDAEGRGMGAEEATDYLAGMTDRFALAYEAELG